MEQVSSRHLTERLAVAMHQHQQDRLGEGDVVGWHDLPNELKEVTRQYALDAQAAVSLLGMEAIAVAKPHHEIPRVELAAEEVELLAKREHDHWKETMSQGWNRETTARRMHPVLVTWEELTEEYRERYRDQVREMLEIFAKAGFELRRQPHNPAAAHTR